MTPADVETLREDAARANDGWVRADDMRALLAHVDALQVERDALQAQLDAVSGALGQTLVESSAGMNDNLRAELRDVRSDLRMAQADYAMLDAHAERMRADKRHVLHRFAHLLAWQQARCLMFDEDAARHIWLGASKSTAEIWRADNERLRAENERLTSERDAARAEVERLRAVVQDWLNVMENDDADCTCEPGDVCPLCRCRAALSEREVAS